MKMKTILSVVAAGMAAVAALPAAAQPLAPLFNGDFEIQDPFVVRPQGWRIFNATTYRTTGDGGTPTAVVRSGAASVVFPPGEGPPNEFLGVQSEEFRDPNDPFSGRNWPEYTFNPTGGAPLNFGFWFNIAAGEPLSGARMGLKICFLRSGQDFSCYQVQEWLDIDPDAAAAFPGTTIVTLPGGAKGLHTNGQWVQYRKVWQQSQFGSFPAPPTNPARLSMMTLRFGSPTAGGRVWLDDVTFSQGGCTADFDGNGTLQPGDIFAFLNAYFAGDPRADFDGNGIRQPADIFAFLNAYFGRTGCPTP
jgi:hypothetical protein